MNTVKDELRKLIRETIELDIEVGDELLGGRFKNKKVIVKDIGIDDKNQPTINGKPLLKFRIKKLIKEEIDKLFELLDFQSDASRQLATNSALFKLPRRGMDPFINYSEMSDFEKDKLESQEEKEQDIEQNFKSPSLNNSSATVRTNIYEEINLVDAGQQNLDKDVSSPLYGGMGKEAQDEFDLYNDNINIALNEVPPGNAREKGSFNNK